MNRFLGCVLGAAAAFPFVVSCGTSQVVVDDTSFGRALIIEPAVIELQVGDSTKVHARLDRELPCIPAQPTKVTWKAEPVGLLGVRIVDDSTVVVSALMAGDAVIVVSLTSDSRLRDAVSIRIR